MATISNNYFDTKGQFSKPISPPIRVRTLAKDLRQATDEVFHGLLGDVANRLQDSRADHQRVKRALDELFVALSIRKQNSGAEEWAQFVEMCRKHPICDLIHQDPFTQRAFAKPRGYAGDARLLDFIYSREEDWPLPPGTTDVGKRIFDYTTMAPASEGVRSRRGFVANLIDRMAEQRHGPHVLSIASGHLREANITAAVTRRQLGRYVALDGDEQSGQEVERCYGKFGVQSVVSRVQRIMTGRVDLGSFDLIYSTGLFDYLDETRGANLVRRLFPMLRPRGRLLVANFLPAVRDIGYMETFMDWKLIYRTRHDMIRLTVDIPESELRSVKLFAEENQNIIFMQLLRN